MKKKPSSLIKKVAKHEDFEILTNGKIHCKVTGHDIKPEMTEFKSYLNSKSYKIAKDKLIKVEKYLPHIVEYKKDNRYLFCKLTKTKLFKRLSVLEKHIKGKKFKRLLKEIENQQNNENGDEEKVNQEEIGEEDEILD